MDKRFWENFYELPLEKIPWNRTQFDWFKEKVDSGTVHGTNALDLGCGTGMKSIYLAEHNFKRVVSIDIVPKAIEYAKTNAKEHNVENATEFILHDATDLSFLKDEKFDLVLDWANIHGLPIEKRGQYAEQISQHIISGKTLFMLRTFSNKGTTDTYFENEVDGVTGRVYLLGKDSILSIFGDYFEILEENESDPFIKNEFVFDEYLMRAK